MFSIFWPLISSAVLLWSMVNQHWLYMGLSGLSMGLWAWSTYCSKQRLLAMRRDQQNQSTSDEP